MSSLVYAAAVQPQILQIRLSPKGIKPVRNGHPWIYNNAIVGAPESARVPEASVRRLTGADALNWEHQQPALVCDPSGRPLGWGTYNRRSRLAVRMLTTDIDAPWDRAACATVVADAVARRGALLADAGTTACRLVFGEGDGLPGLVADRYGDLVSVQYSAAFAWDNRETIEAALLAALGEHGVEARLLRTWDERMRDREGITGVPAGKAGGGGAAGGTDAPDDATAGAVTVSEGGLPWLVRPGAGQKTGLFCDQRDNRRRVAAWSSGRRVLDAFSYHGGFGLTALAAGAREVCCIDSSADAVEMIGRNAAAQESAAAGALSAVRGDVFAMLHGEGVPGGIASWDLIVLDPPKLVPGRRHLEAGLRSYKDLNRLVMRDMHPGALLATFSCSGAVSREDFRRMLAWAAVDAGRTVRILETFGQPSDHPVPLAFPEAEYLKGYLLQVSGSPR